ncbi:MAG: MATE family efflux transporter [Myxococcota bacterium]|nr:MATE family efflux transporter [Myxococcota bacterium]
MREGADAEVAPVPTLLQRLRDRDHTRAGIVGSLVVLALPSALTGVFGGGLFQMAELHFLGLLGPEAVAAAGATNQILRQFFFLLTFGVTVATQMWIARHVGEGSVEEAEHAAGQSFLLGAVLALAAALAGAFFTEPLVAFVAGDPAVAELGVVYARITLLTLSVFVASQIFSSVLAGAGDSTTPMIVTLITTPVGIGAQWALTFGWHGIPALGIGGIAWGAAAGGVVSIGMFAWTLLTGRCRVHLRGRHFVPDAALLRRLLSFSWQPAMHFVARSLIIMVFMWLSGRLGGDVQAAYTIGMRIEMMAVMLAFPVANACATLVGQNLGAGDVSRAWQSIRIASGVILGLLIPGAAALFVFRFDVVALFTDEPAVLEMAAEYLFYASVQMAFYGPYFVAFRSLQAAGDMNGPMIISVSVAVLIGAPLGLWLSSYTDLGATGMWIANLVYGSLNAILMVAWLLTGRWTRGTRAPAT